jgi:hypothetical protein
MSNVNFVFDSGVSRRGDVLAANNSTPFEWSHLKFTAPKKSAASSELSCIARTNVNGSSKNAFVLTLNGGTVDRVTHTRTDFHTLFVKLPTGSSSGKKKNAGGSLGSLGGELKKFVDSLDKHVIDVAKGKVDEWFNRTMSGDLVEEYYRGSTTSAPSLRFVISGDLPDEKLLSGALVNVSLQLVGVQFKSQYFTCVWTIADIEEAHEPVDLEDISDKGFGFFPDDEEDPEEDDEELNLDEEDGPTFEERRDMIESETARLGGLLSQWESLESELVQRISEARQNAERAREALTKLSSSNASGFAEAYAEAESIITFYRQPMPTV